MACAVKAGRDIDSTRQRAAWCRQSLAEATEKRESGKLGIFPRFCALLNRVFRQAQVRRREKVERQGSCRYDELCMK